MPDSAVNTDSNSVPSPEQQAARALVGPQAMQPSPAAPTASSSPAPAMQPPRDAKEAVDQHHSILGRVASALLGRQVDYQVDPTTGKTVAVETPQKPGDLFRHLLAGALIGGAAAKGTNSVLAGFSRGAVAGMDQNRDADQQRYARAQQQFKDTQESQRTQDEKLKTTAQMEMWNKENLLHERDSNLREAEYHEKHNERNELVRERARDAGALDAPIQGNGEVGNGAKFEKLFVSQPDLFKAPSGYVRLLTNDTDMDGVRFDASKGYVDEHGNPVDLKDRTSWHVQFIPHNAAKDPQDISGADLNRAFPKTTGGLADPKKVYRMPLESVVGIGTKEHTSNRTEAAERWHEQHDAIMSELRELQNKADNYTKQANAAEHEFDQKTAKELRQKAQDAYDEYDEVKKQAHPNSQIRKMDRNTPATAKPQPIKVGDVKTVNGQQVRVTKVLPNGKYEGEPVQ